MPPIPVDDYTPTQKRQRMDNPSMLDLFEQSSESDIEYERMVSEIFLQNFIFLDPTLTSLATFLDFVSRNGQ